MAGLVDRPYGSPAADPARFAAFQKLGPAEKRLLLDDLCVIDAPSWAQVKVSMTLDPWQRAFLRATGNTAVVASRRVAWAHRTPGHLPAGLNPRVNGSLFCPAGGKSAV